jgi:hypothetical protein
MKQNEKDADEACPFPPGIDIPRKSGLGAILGSILVVDWRLVAPVLSLGLILIISGLLISPPIPFTAPREPSTWNGTIPQFSPLFPMLSGWVPMYSKQVVHNGGLILDEGEEYLIENCTYILNGTFQASGNSSLVLRNSELWVRGRTTFPPYGDMNFTDTSTLMVYNSTILGPTIGSGASIFLSDNSVANVNHSNITYVNFNGDDGSRIEVDHSTAGAIYVASSASCSINNSNVDLVAPGGLKYDPDPALPWLNQAGGSRTHALFPWLDTKVEVLNSSVGQLAVGVLGSRIEVNGSIPQETSWSPSTFCSGGEWFNVSLLDSSIGTVLIFANNTTISLENSVDISYLIAINSTVNVVNSSIPILLLERCDSSLDNSVFKNLAFFGDSEAFVKGSLANILSIYYFKGRLECGGFMVNRSLFGYDNNASIIGGLKLLEKHGDTNLFKFSRLNRGYQVFTEAIGLAMRDATLILRDGNDTIKWSGKTDASGQATFNLTYYNLWKLDSGLWVADNMTRTLTLTATLGDQQQVRNVTAESDTPIVFSFDRQAEPPIWSNKYFLFVTGGLVIAATLAYIYSKSRRRVVSLQ